ncbi:MAG: MFS transporter [Bacteroidia bacterium]|nr:MAG: MFS transporter [Bacteroidia bacterium]PIE86214.1 MAG: MFS transporter [Bacteroidia bacterium]
MSENNEKRIEREEVVIRFSGDSGDGMQLTGTQFSDTAALVGNDVSTFPDYPAEIRAPQGTVGGVSGFQIHFGHAEIETPGDYADVLVAMNPAALKANIEWVKIGGTIIIDVDAFTPQNIAKAGYTDMPLKDGKYGDYKVIEAPISSLTKLCLKDSGLDKKNILRSKNMFALGIVYWMFERPLKHTEQFLEQKFKSRQSIVKANKEVLKSGYHFGQVIEAIQPHYKVAPAKVKKGKFRNISGNTATAWGLIAGAEKAGLKLFCGSYPITPATEILQELAARKDLGVKTFQAEDEIAGICTSIGASFAGSLAVTTTSGPGLALKTEAIGLAIITELPLVIVDVQRGGPSTGLPTKTEQSDLLQAIHGRHGESPLPVICAGRPSSCFKFAIEACRIALEYMTPVILLTDGFIANGAEPWEIPNMDDFPKIKTNFAKEGEEYQPYARDPETLVRKWAVPGMKGLEHRIGGLEKMDITGAVSYVPKNHEVMTYYRKEKINRIANDLPLLKLRGEEEGDLLVVGWGGTYGHLGTAVKQMQKEGKKVSLAHFNYLFPLPKNTGEVFSRFKKIVVAELNTGQFAEYLRSRFEGVKFSQYNKIQGLPFTVNELTDNFNKLLEEE